MKNATGGIGFLWTTGRSPLERCCVYVPPQLKHGTSLKKARNFRSEKLALEKSLSCRKQVLTVKTIMIRISKRSSGSISRCVFWWLEFVLEKSVFEKIFIDGCALSRAPEFLVFFSFPLINQNERIDIYAKSTEPYLAVEFKMSSLAMK